MECCSRLGILTLLSAFTVLAGCAPTVPPNACSANHGGCDPNAFCSTNGTTAVCTCFPGFSGTGQSCSPASPCTEDFGGCDPNATCVAANAFSLCQCKTGYLGDGYHCELAPTCPVNNGGCDPNASCVESDGTVSCSCKTNYVGNGLTCRTCTSTTCGPNAACSVDEAAGRIDCTCDEGYVEGTGGEAGCVPENNCVVNNGGCSTNATCTPTDAGSPQCACNAEFTGDGGVCVPVALCADDNGGCDPMATCTDTPSGPDCTCPHGFASTNQGVTCTSDFCEMSLDDCDSNATCTDTSTSFMCVCKSGYTGTGTTCTEIDGCSPNPCGANQICTKDTNGAGTFSCTCDTGYQQSTLADGGISCAPINGCANTSLCPGAHQMCVATTPGEHECECVTGYAMQPEADGGGGDETCRPVDLCKESPSTACPANETCTDTGPGTVSCACNSPYELSGGACVPINHCEDTTPPCDPNATCKFTGAGTYMCTCNAGFSGSGKACQSHYVQVAIGDRHMCGIRNDDPASNNDGTLWCWGWNDRGQFGIGAITTTAPITTPANVQIPNITGPVYWSYVAAGTDSTCAIVSSSPSNPSTIRNSLYCWGSNTDGQVGAGSSSVGLYMTPQEIAKGFTWYSVGSEGNHTCGYGNGGNIYCWGLNVLGQLGLGSSSTTPTTSPAEIHGSSTQYGSVSVGANSTCALSGTQLMCWGDNTYDELGLGSGGATSETSATPVGAAIAPTDGEPAGTNPWTSVTSGQFGSCGLQSDFSLWCWGANDRGQAGINSLATPQPSPMPVVNAMGTYSSWSQVVLGSEHACGLDSNGAVFCWGDNTAGQLGIGSYNPAYKLTPVAVAFPPADMLTFQSIASNPGSCPSNISSTNIGMCNGGPYGGIYTCAIDMSYDLWCWGEPSTSSQQIYPYGISPTLVTR